MGSMISKLHLEGNLVAVKQKHLTLVHLLLPHLLLVHLLLYLLPLHLLQVGLLYLLQLLLLYLLQLLRLMHPHCSYFLPYGNCTYNVPDTHPTDNVPDDSCRSLPTPYPTDVPPTTCGEKGASCTKHDQCCGKKCEEYLFFWDWISHFVKFSMIFFCVKLCILIFANEGVHLYFHCKLDFNKSCDFIYR